MSEPVGPIVAARTGGAAFVPLMLALTFSTGIIDAVGYLGLDRVFTGNMTGNVIILGMGLVGADDLPVVGPAIALGAFVVGAALGGWVLRATPASWTMRTTVLLTLVTAALAAVAVMLSAVPVYPGSASALSVTGGLGAAMGVQAATARRLAVADLPTVVVTSTLTGLFADAAAGDDADRRWKRRGGAVLLIGAGAATGAALLRWEPGAGVFLSAAITAVVTLVGALAARR